MGKLAVFVTLYLHGFRWRLSRSYTNNRKIAWNSINCLIWWYTVQRSRPSSSSLFETGHRQAKTAKNVLTLTRPKKMLRRVRTREKKPVMCCFDFAPSCFHMYSKLMRGECSPVISDTLYSHHFRPYKFWQPSVGMWVCIASLASELLFALFFKVLTVYTKHLRVTSAWHCLAKVRS